MKTLRFFVLTIATLFIALAINAQSKMTVKLKNGSEQTFYVSEIEQMTWTEDETSGGENDPGEQSVTGKAVDLGLSVKWANCNVGATSPEDYGDYFAWGETSPKDSYDLPTYFDTKDGGFTFDIYNDNGGATTLKPEDDAAHVNWGGSWRMPTKAEQDELRTNCTWTWTTQNGVNGYKVTGTNGNSIFLPASGYCCRSSFYNVGSCGRYWSSSLDASDLDYAYVLYFFSDYVYVDGYGRPYGLSVRAVCP